MTASGTVLWSGSGIDVGGGGGTTGVWLAWTAVLDMFPLIFLNGVPVVLLMEYNGFVDRFVLCFTCGMNIYDCGDSHFHGGKFVFGSRKHKCIDDVVLVLFGDVTPVHDPKANSSQKYLTNQP